jgi:glycyl-tRNA synthetase
MPKTQENPVMDKIISLCKRRGFIFPGSEIYGGLANSWDYGPLGVELKNNIKRLWWKTFVQERDDVVGLDAALIMNPRVWEASGHVANFNDPLVEDKKTNERFRLDHLLEEKGISVSRMSFDVMVAKVKELNLKSPKGNELTPPRQFNMMFQTHLGPVADNENTVYLRPETAQGMFVDFKTIQEASRQRIPFGIAQIGHAFRNEITPGNFIFRTREFEQMEIEFFVHPSDWEKWFEYWLDQQKNWLRMIGVKDEDLYFHEIPAEERAHYSKRSVDTEYKYPFGLKELYGLAYRTDYDLKAHSATAKQDLTYRDPVTNELYTPHCIEPTWGVNRTLLVVLCSAFEELDARSGEEEAVHEKEVVLRLPRKLAPIKIAVLPLSKKEPLSQIGHELTMSLKKIYSCQYDETGSIGKRYRRQDEIGTPFCITVDFDTVDDKKVTIRDRDTMAQERVEIDRLMEWFADKGLTI